MKIENVNQKAAVTVFGVTFHGVDELRDYANRGEPKGGVYVGEDWQRYPCFDSEDYAYENRYYSNFVFALSKEMLATKMEALKKMEWSCNYRKLNPDTPDALLPIMYFRGDSHDPLQIGVCEYVIF